MSSGNWRVFRSGVIASVKTKNRSVQSPVVCCSVSTGFMPRSPRSNPQVSDAKGIDDTRNTTTFVHLLVNSFRKFVAVLVKLLQVHAVIQRSDLIAIAVKDDRLAAEE